MGCICCEAQAEEGGGAVKGESSGFGKGSLARKMAQEVLKEQSWLTTMCRFRLEKLRARSVLRSVSSVRQRVVSLNLCSQHLGGKEINRM